MNLSRAKRSQLAMAVMEGIVIDVFKPQAWLEASVEAFPLPYRYKVKGELAFVAPQHLRI